MFIKIIPNREKWLLFLLAFSMFHSAGLAQELLRKNLYWNNGAHYNPAYMGYGSMFQASFQSTLSTKELAPGYSLVNVGGSVASNLKLGFTFASEKQGNYSNNTIQGGYAFSFGNRASQLTFGMTVGVILSNFETVDYNTNPYVDPTDPFLVGNGFRRNKFVMGLGAVYEWNKIELGLAAPVLLRDGGELYTNLNLKVQYPIELGDLQVSPIGFVQYTDVGLDFYDLSALTEWRNMVWALVGFRSDEQLNTGIGFSKEGFGLGYTLVSSFGEYQALNPFIHELVLTFSMPEKDLKNNNFKNALKSLKRKRK